MIEITLKLEKPARKSGGDKYEAEYSISPFSIYLPQAISRPKGNIPVETLKMTLEA
jgi:hypothetical protein